MIAPQAAVMVMDHVPEMEEVSELAALHLEEFPAEEAHAMCDIVYEPPEWLAINERDQMGAFMRDGAACILIIYMSEGHGDDEDEEQLEDEDDETDW